MSSAVAVEVRDPVASGSPADKSAGTPPAPEPRAAGGRFAFVRRNGWALGDQVLISGTNFITAVLPARAMDRDQFGTFSTINAALLFVNIFQSTLITQAHNVLGLTRRFSADL